MPAPPHPTEYFKAADPVTPVLHDVNQQNKGTENDKEWQDQFSPTKRREAGRMTRPH